jgi:hypothetical protein
MCGASGLGAALVRGTRSELSNRVARRRMTWAVLALDLIFGPSDMLWDRK